MVSLKIIYCMDVTTRMTTRTAHTFTVPHMTTVVTWISRSWDPRSVTVSSFFWFYGPNFASFYATGMFFSVLKSSWTAAPIFHITRPHFSEENSLKVRGKSKSCPENDQKSSIFHQNRSKICLKVFKKILSPNFFILLKIHRLPVVWGLYNYRNHFDKW